MSKAWNSPPVGSQNTGTTSIDVLPLTNEMPKRAWHALLRPKLIERAVLLADLALIVAAGLLCSSGYSWITSDTFTKLPAFAGLGLVVAVNFTAMMTARQNYRLKNLALFSRQFRDSIIIWTGVYGMLALVGFAMKISSEFSRGTTVLFYIGGLAAVLSWRFLIASFLLQALAKGSFAKKKIIIISEQDQHFSSRPLHELRRYGYHAVRTCEVSTVEIAAPAMIASLRSKLADVVQIARVEQIEDVYILVDWRHRRAIQYILQALAVLPISVHLVPDENTAQFLNYPIANVGGTWTAVLSRPPLSPTERAAKRILDLSLATAGFLAVLPLMLVTALLIKLDSRGPILFRQKRNGFNGQTFDIFKFRTMDVLEDGPRIAQATPNDPRVTRLGRWLRSSSIDELPQLFNVIRGDMSLVGPRPHATSHNSEYENLIANYAFRHHVKPGLTGWAQVNGFRGETRHIEQMKHRVEHDLWYINNWSPLLDLRIILQTVTVVLRQNAAY
jgi:Undecaprenyl-phosphate glucose phosphotransferase